MFEMDAVDAKLLTEAQAAFPLCEHPFQELGARANIGPTESMARFRRMKACKVLRQVSAIFDSKALGYQSALVAAQVEPERIEAAAALISSHAGVSHNYQRDNAMNLWFTLATPPGTLFEVEAGKLCVAAGALRWHALPSLRTFKIGVSFDLTGAGKTSHTTAHRHARGPVALSARDKEFIRVLQMDLPIQERPFDAMALSRGTDRDELFDWMTSASQRGFMRRYAAVIRHREAGFSANAMGVWVVPEERIEEVGALFAASGQVTHAYQRPTFAGWPYNLFTMVHGKDSDACEAILKELSQVVGITERASLYSTREFKKTRVVYFDEDASKRLWQSLADSPKHG